MRLRDRMRRGQHGVVGAVTWVVFLVLSLCRVEPIPTYYYVFAWYPALLVVDALAARRRGFSWLSERPSVVLALAAWSVPFWLLFEAINLRLQNWYYVGVPRDLLSGRVYLVLSFATVLPGLFLTADLLAAYGLFEGRRTKRFRATPRLLAGMVATGILFAVLPLLFPRYFYPLVWGAVFLLIEPFCRRPGVASWLREMEKGRPARLLRILVAGALCGLFWEVMNMPARSKWIYTVPFFDRTLGVEMPPLGFLGFLPFAVEAASFVALLEITGLAPRAESRRMRVPPLPVFVRLFAVPLAVLAGSAAVVLELERRTVCARAPAVADLPGIERREAAILALDGIREASELLARARDPSGREELARRLEVSVERVAYLVRAATLACWRGLGNEHAASLISIGIDSPEALRGADPAAVYRSLRFVSDAPCLRPERVRVWCREAPLGR